MRRGAWRQMAGVAAAIGENGKGIKAAALALALCMAARVARASSIVNDGDAAGAAK